jgi:hypothetical protein
MHLSLQGLDLPPPTLHEQIANINEKVSDERHLLCQHFRRP